MAGIGGVSFQSPREVLAEELRRVAPATRVDRAQQLNFLSSVEQLHAPVRDVVPGTPLEWYAGNGLPTVIQKVGMILDIKA